MQGPDTDAQDQPPPFFTFDLQRTAGPYRWVNNGPDGPETKLPLYPDQQTSSDRSGMSQRFAISKAEVASIVTYALSRSLIQATTSSQITAKTIGPRNSPVIP